MSTPTAQAAINILQYQLTAARASSDRVAECETLAKIPRYVPSEQAPPTRYFSNMTRDRLKATLHQG